MKARELREFQRIIMPGHPRWNRFKDWIAGHPETIAYSAVTATCAGEFLTAGTAHGRASALQIGVTSVMGIFVAEAREVAKAAPYRTRADKVVESAISVLGFAAGCAMVCMQRMPELGVVVASAAIAASGIYSSVKTALVKPLSCVVHHAGLAVSGFVATAGLAVTFLSMSLGTISAPLTCINYALFLLGMNCIGKISDSIPGHKAMPQA